MINRRPGSRFDRGRVATAAAVATATVTQTIAGFPVSLTHVSSSPDNLASGQGVAFNPALSRFWASAGLAALNETRSLYEYDASYNQVVAGSPIGIAQGLPSGTTQLNGITYYGGKLYVGYNNYPTTPEAGGVIVVDPANLSAIETVHPASNGHTEGCAIRMTARGVEAFVFSHSSTVIERRDLATWTLQGTHEFGPWPVVTAATYYQGGGWFGDCLCLGLHGSQSRPAAIDVCWWDDTALTFTPLYRMDRPIATTGQGFNFASQTLAFFAERDIAPDPDMYRIVRASVSSIATLPHNTPNGASAQLTDLQYWYQRLTWDAATPEWRLVDSMGNGATQHAPANFDATHVYPTPSSDGAKIRFDGDTGGGSSLPLGNLFGASGWTLATIWFRKFKLLRTSSIDTLLSWDASGSNTGDGRIELNTTGAGSIRMFFNNNLNTVTAPVGSLTLGVECDLCVTLTASGPRIYINGTQVATAVTAGKFGGTNQNVYLGSNFAGTACAKFECWDVRFYNAVKDPTVLATYDMWSD